MKLLTKEIKEKLPKLYVQEDKGDDAIVHIKFFTPWSNWTWFILEGEETDEGEWLFFALVDGFEKEFGYVSLKELESLKGPGGLGVERDKFWEPKRVGDIK